MRPDQTVGKKQFILLNQGGQALVEYILMLVISLSLLFAAKKLFTNFNTYADNYIGGYMACLMEFGELPTLGIRVDDLKKHQGGNAKTCEAKFEKFTIAGGRPPTSSGGGSSGSGGSGGGKNGSGKNGNGSNSGSNGDGSSSSSSSGSSSELFGSNSNKNKKNNSYGNGRIQRTDDGYGSGDNGFDTAKANSKVTIIEDEDGDKKKSSSAYGRTTMVNNSYRRPGYGDKYRAITGSELQQMELTIKKQKPKPVATRVKIADIEDGKRGPARYTVDPQELKKVAEVEENTEMLSFGGIFRWLLIVGMVVAIVIFFGGQLLNYSKSQE